MKAIDPKMQRSIEAKLFYTDRIHGLPPSSTLADVNAAPFLASIVSCQHPDHDTEQWPPS
ncbi:hypothetical protein [Hyphomicrobium sp.]|jgi:hypothetical protein|uniref:hypothetical protein n=1 Tax=Hyphomicrobium sp. TaxID=82 RepID=UPI003FA5C6EC